MVTRNRSTNVRSKSARTEPRVSLTPSVHALALATANIRGTTVRDYIEHLIRSSDDGETTRQLTAFAVATGKHLPVLMGKIDGIADFIADRYVLDTHRATDGDDA